MTHLCLTHNDEKADDRPWCRTYRRTYEADSTAWLEGPRGPFGERPQFISPLPGCSWEPDAWPEPWEGISGTIRDQDDLLALDEPALRRREIVVAMAYALNSAISVGNPAPIVSRMNDRFSAHRDSARVGDLVIESTTLYQGSAREKWFMGFGILLANRWEWAETHVDHAKRMAGYEDDPFDRFIDNIWYVQYGSNDDICRWENCSFMAIPTDLETVRALREPAATGGVITRESLVSSLTDSGFELNLQ